MQETSLRNSATWAAYQDRIQRYQRLREIIEAINKNLSLDSVADTLTAISFSAVSGEKGNCILYLVDPQTQHLNIYKTKKEDKRLVIKEKEGDIFDAWVSRHASPLLVEDVRKDFRFDPEKAGGGFSRKVISLVSAPLLSGTRLLGLLRLESGLERSFSQEDLRMLVAVSDIGGVALENARLFQRMQELAIHDELTGLFTKGYFIHRLQEECKRAAGQPGGVVSLLMADIDHFKDYNDRFGHTAGDIVLKVISMLISSFFSEGQVIASRFGGEEFCFALPHKDKQKALAAAEGLRMLIEKTRVDLRGRQTGVTVSIGVSCFPEDASEAADLIAKADRAMYKAKQAGRNKVMEY